jgi:acetyl-CoA/propionyl-CoA carboxylase biotin carboxyl carrier protein
MIAKIMTAGRDRRSAIRRMRRALDEVVVTGIQTTLPFDRALVRDGAFLEDDGSALSTEWVAERWDGVAARNSLRRAAAVAAARAVEDATQPTPSLRKDTVSRSKWAETGREAATDRWPR